MIEILLLILKIIGIIILCIIGLVILILLIVSWVPIRYGADFSKYEKLSLSVYVSWFLKALSFEFYLKDGEHGTRLKLLGRKLGGSRGEESGTAEAKTEETEKEEKPPDQPEPMQQESSGTEAGSSGSTPAAAAEEEKKEEAPSESTAPDTEAGAGKEETAEAAEDNTQTDGTAQQAEQEKTEEEETEAEEKEALPLGERLDEMLYRFQEKYTDLEDKWEGIRDKYEFLTDPHAEREYGRVLRNVGKILRHLLPKHLTGRIHYGLDSPALTGKILAYYCALAPVHRYALMPEPDFTQTVIEGEAHLKGTVFIGYIVCKVLATVLNRDVLYLLLNFRKHFRKSQEG